MMSEFGFYSTKDTEENRSCRLVLRIASDFKQCPDFLQGSNVIKFLQEQSVESRSVRLSACPGSVQGSPESLFNVGLITFGMVTAVYSVWCILSHCL
jgi:hypothetical protein